MNDAKQLFSAYFHQDWQSEAASWEEQLQNAIQQEPSSAILGALENLEAAVLPTLTEEKAQKIVRLDLSCDIHPPSLGMSYLTWILAVRDMLRSTRTAA